MSVGVDGSFAGPLFVEEEIHMSCTGIDDMIGKDQYQRFQRLFKAWVIPYAVQVGIGLRIWRWVFMVFFRFRLFRSAGGRPAIASRGYVGSKIAPCWVSLLCCSIR